MLSLSLAARADLVRKRCGSARKLAASIGTAHTTVTRTMRGEAKSRETQQAIADACKVSRVKMFGAGPKAAA